MARDTTKSYAGRQVDLELLQHVDKMLASQPVRPDIVVPRIVSGIEKAVQRYTKLFLTNVGSVRADTSVGNTMLHAIGQGMVSNMAELNYQYAVANANTLAILDREDSDIDAYGDIPDDERVVGADLIDLELKYDSLTGGRVYVHVRLNTAAEDSYTFVIPVASGIT